MPDWLLSLAAAIVGGGGVGAVCKGYIALIERRHAHAIELMRANGQVKADADKVGFEQQRQVRVDENTELHRLIDELRADRQQLWDEFAAFRESSNRLISAINSDHTDCLLEQARLRKTEEYLQQQDKDNKRRIGQLEAEICELKKGGQP